MIPANPRAGSIHSRSNVEALENAPPVNCDGDAVIVIDDDMAMLVVMDMLMFLEAEVDEGCIDVFVMLVVEVLVPE